MSAPFADQLFALFLFALISATTPGPNNVMLLTSGVNFGFRRTIPHMCGVSLGFPLMTASVALGLGSVFVRLPWLHDVVAAIGVVYLLWLALKIAMAPVGRGLETNLRAARPMTFFAAVAFQWVNVKAWVTAISGVSVYVPDGLSALTGSAVLFAVFLSTAVISVVQWTLFGTLIARFLHDPLRLRIFNLTMALLLVASLWPAFVDIGRWIAG